MTTLQLLDTAATLEKAGSSFLPGPCDEGNRAKGKKEVVRFVREEDYEVC